jgi:hypothetical protein
MYPIFQEKRGWGVKGLGASVHHIFAEIIHRQLQLLSWDSCGMMIDKCFSLVLSSVYMFTSLFYHMYVFI